MLNADQTGDCLVLVPNSGRTFPSSATNTDGNIFYCDSEMSIWSYLSLVLLGIRSNNVVLSITKLFLPI